MMRKDWIEVDLGLVCGFKGGGTPSKSVSSYWNGGIPWASIKDVKGSYLTQTEDFITEEGLNNSASNLAFENEIILATRINPGRPIISKIKTAVNQDLKIVKPLITFSNKFLFYIFKKIEPEVIKASSGTTVLGINLTNLREIQVPVPPLPEQRAIVSKIEELFSELDHSIASFKAAKAKLEIYRQAVLKKAFEGGFTSKENPLGELPKGWKLVKFKDLGIWKGGGTPSKSIEKYWEDGDVLWVSPKDMKCKVILDSVDKITEEAISESSTKWIEEGAILFVVRSGILRRTLPLAIAGRRLTVNQDLQAFLPNNGLNSDFVYWYCKSQEREIRDKCSKDGTTVESIDSTSLKNYLLPLCSVEEQIQIVQEIETRLSVADKLAETIEINLKKSEALRQSILKKAFEGKLLSEPELEACRKEADWEPVEKLLERIKSERKK